MENNKKDKDELEKALELRERIKKQNPDFVRQESWRFKRLKKSWRKPRGIDSKMRMKVKGWPPTVNVGYRGPKAVRGLHPSGYKDILVHNVKEVKEINPETEAIRIAHAVGKRKRGKILVEARKRDIKVLNFQTLEEETGREEETEGTESDEELEEQKTEEEIDEQ